jgi:hypothetical protein
MHTRCWYANTYLNTRIPIWIREYLRANTCSALHCAGLCLLFYKLVRSLYYFICAYMYVCAYVPPNHYAFLCPSLWVMCLLLCWPVPLYCKDSKCKTFVLLPLYSWCMYASMPYTSLGCSHLVQGLRLVFSTVWFRKIWQECARWQNQTASRSSTTLWPALWPV